MSEYCRCHFFSYRHRVFRLTIGRNRDGGRLFVELDEHVGPDDDDFAQIRLVHTDLLGVLASITIVLGYPPFNGGLRRNVDLLGRLINQPGHMLSVSWADLGSYDMALSLADIVGCSKNT